MSCRQILWLILILMGATGMAVGEESHHTYSEPTSSKIETGNVSYFIESKLGPTKNDRCEDGLFFSKDYLVVVDGASDKSGFLYDGHTGGWLCKETILRVFRELSGDESPEEVVARINAALTEIYFKYKVDFKAEPQRRFSAVLIWYDFRRKTLYALGDCKARVDGKLFNAEEKTVDRLNSELRAQVLKESELDLTKPLVKDPGREYILPLLKGQARYQNNPEAPEELGYWVIDGLDIPPSEVKSWKLDKAPHTIELSSDGYAEFPNHTTVEAYESLLHDLLAEDPNLVLRVKSTKGLKVGNVSFDDRTILIYKR